MRIEDKYKLKVTSNGGPSNERGFGNKNKNNSSSSSSSSSSSNTTPPSPTIHECAEAGDLIAFQTLLFRNPYLLNDQSILMKQTPLHIAASLNRIEIVKFLLSWGGPGKVELEAGNVYGETPLHAAANNGCSETASLLLTCGANIEARNNNFLAPLHLAVKFSLRTGDIPIVQTLLEFNADCFARDREGLAPINYIPENEDRLCELFGKHLALNIHNGRLQHDYVRAEMSKRTNQNNQTSGLASSNQGDTSNHEIQAKMDEFNEELSKFVGLHDLKEQLRKWAKGMLLDEKRRAMGYNLGPRKLPHMAFLGNPGTGKTTIARILGKLLMSVGVLSSDSVTEVQRTDLVGEYLGQTGPKTRKKINEAMGGILFVDEAYRLVPQQSAGDYTDYGVEAMEEIMSVLEDGELVVVFAGYTEPMNRVFSSNEGFCRRVTHFFNFDNFTCNDMAEMLLIKMTKQSEKNRLYGFKLHPLCTYDVVVKVIEGNSTEKLRNKMNGGLVDHMLNSARENLDSRLTFDAKEEELLTITLADLEAGLKAVAKRVKVD